MIKKLMTAAALLTMVGTASSATLYTTGVLDFNKTTKGSYLGKIGAAVPVTVLKKQGSLSYVRISGWTLAEYPSMIFAEPDAAEYFGKNCEWIAPKPGTDVAMMIAMAHELESSGKVDREFIRKYTVGYDKFIAYVLGKTDGVAKTPAWAEKICGVKADAIKRLAHLMRERRSMLMGGWGIQRAQHGEQVHWMMVVLAAMCGHIGQPAAASASAITTPTAVRPPRWLPLWAAFPLIRRAAAKASPGSANPWRPFLWLALPTASSILERRSTTTARRLPIRTFVWSSGRVATRLPSRKTPTV